MQATPFAARLQKHSCSCATAIFQPCCVRIQIRPSCKKPETNVGDVADSPSTLTDEGFFCGHLLMISSSAAVDDARRADGAVSTNSQHYTYATPGRCDLSRRGVRHTHLFKSAFTRILWHRGPCTVFLNQILRRNLVQRCMQARLSRMNLGDEM